MDGYREPLPDLAGTVQSWLSALETRGNQGVVLGLYGLHGRKLCLLKLRRGANLQQLMTAEELGLWQDSDVVLLQRVVLQAALGIDSLEQQARHLGYTRDGAEAVLDVEAGEYQLAFLLNPAPVTSIFDAADAGRRLPQKSTYFYPKTPAGLVMNPLWDE